MRVSTCRLSLAEEAVAVVVAEFDAGAPVTASGTGGMDARKGNVEA